MLQRATVNKSPLSGSGYSGYPPCMVPAMRKRGNNPAQRFIDLTVVVISAGLLTAGFNLYTEPRAMKLFPVGHILGC